MNKLKLHNTLGNKLEEFIPIDKDNVRIYACGPTVYNYAHVGNARMAVVNDLLVQFLRTIYPKVTYVSNITDIDDKIIAASEETNVPIKELTTKFTTIYNEDMSVLGVKLPDIQPRATEHINEMIELTKLLIQNNFAYEKEGHVLFHVPAFKDYGSLSRRNRDEQIMGSRVEIAPYKKDPTDFVLWKPSSSPKPGWESPWGFGRPGWHLECSAMSEKTLGLPFDIHSGGADLIFPHHENEIAQTCAAHNNINDLKSFAKYWFHNGFVNVEGEKMSKSLGNISLVNELIKEFKGEVLRLTLVSAHYRQPLNWTRNIIKQNSTMLDRFYRNLKELENIEAYKDNNQIDDNVIEGLYDDLNTPKVIAELNVLSNQIGSADKKMKAKIKYNLLEVGKIIGILQNNPDKWFGYGKSANLDETAIERLIKERNEARGNKNFDVADQIRDELKEKGIEIEDTKKGTVWKSI
ncbi:MAG: Cysteine--tRNA ligase [Alphaproteobacteria bacterium MarineAlpha5_Bin5]|nr:MAG: Cysteine--tRNA ligase [Alphaproteobacteria bacterium MarineAlpha5_Bin5]|tara:strand:+ start:129 stop:1520 length:1392 start_codon:yes stop_codon:yes gene_type:complete